MSASDRAARRTWCAGLGGLLGTLIVGCGGGRPKPVTPREPPLEPLRLRPITDLVVGAGIRWLVLIEPRDLLGNSAIRPGLSRFAPEGRLAVFERVTAIDPAALNEAVVAGYDDSTLFVLDGVSDPREAERRFRDRLVRDVIHKVYRPDATWTHGRTATGKVRALSALSPGVVAIEGGGTLRSKVALLFAIGRLHKSPRALSLPDVRGVLDALGPAPLRALAPGPFGDEWADALNGMLAVCTALGFSARVGQRGQLDLALRLAGAWGERSKLAAENLMTGWQELASSTIGRLLRLDETLAPPGIVASDEMVGVDLRLDGVALLDGLYDVVAADVREILDLGGGETR